MSYMSKFVAALVALLLMALVASRQLFVFAVSDPATESSHLWLAAIAGINACAASVFMFYFFSRHEKNKWSKVAMTPTGPLDFNALNPLARAPFHAARWAVANRG
jgi:H+/Cl- antiporter ClcA